jgi:hypothetical protein
MSQICKQLAKEKSFEVLMNDIEHPHHKGRPGYVQNIDIKYVVSKLCIKKKLHIF